MHGIWINATFVFQLFFAELMYSHSFTKRSRFALRCIGAVLLCLVISLMDFFSGNLITDSFLFFLDFALILLPIMLCFQNSIWNLLFAGVAGYATQFFSSMVQAILTPLIAPFLPAGIASELVPMAAAVIPVYLIMYFLFARKIQRGECPNVNNKRLILMTGFIFFICIFFHQLAMTEAETQKRSISMAESLYGMTCCLLLLLILFGMVDNRKMQVQMGIMRQLWNEEKEQYEKAKENIELINIRCHDLKHQIAKLGAASDQDLIRELQNEINIYDAMMHTGNTVLDTIITEKNLLCRKNEIRFSCMADGKLLQNLDTGELYAFLGNAVDNAMESALKLEDPEKRVISLTVKRSGNFVLIEIENYFQGNLKFDDGLPVTTKENQQFHGFGMKSIRRFVEKNHGNMRIFTDNQIFRLVVLLPITDV